jgi:hypothetical protein
MDREQILLVVGMHRSGTSLVASWLQSSGLNIGEQLLGAGDGNIKGHFENIDFYEFHKAVLRSQGIHEHGWTLQEQIQVEDSYLEKAKILIKRNTKKPIWGWKDPRTTLFLDFWANLLPNAKFVLIYRSPWEVVDSIYRRGTDVVFQTQPDLAVKVWIHYNRKIIDFYDRWSPRCLLVNIDSIIQNPQNFIEAINYHLQVNLNIVDNNIYESSLFHRHPPHSYRPTLIDRYFPQAIETYRELETREWQLENIFQENWQDLIRTVPDRSWIFRDWSVSCYLETQSKKAQLELEKKQEELLENNSLLARIESELTEIQTKSVTDSFDLQHLFLQLENLRQQFKIATVGLTKVRLNLKFWSKKLKQYWEQSASK